MTLKSLIISITAGAMLAVTGSAWGMSDASDRSQAAVPDAVERAVAASQRNLGQVATSPDWFERAVAASQRQQGPATYRDAFERAALQGVTAGELPGHVDRYESGLGRVPSPTAAPDRDIEWPQIGAGFGIGILLAIGLVLGLRLANVRPLAHR
ncbi:MAG TPA: hypothetical protein VNJ53_06975 [Gaiellaceae bacterium]|nr:hypothetical protein [Gaiellaceae bacterium]